MDDLSDFRSRNPVSALFVKPAVLPNDIGFQALTG